MKIKIEYTKGNASSEDLMAMKTFIEKKKVDTLKKVEVATKKPKKGEMGPGLANALTALIGAATGPLTTLAEALVELVKLKRSEVRIVGTSGAEIFISGKLKKNELNDAIVKFYAQESANVKKGAKREKKSAPPTPPQAEAKA
ncbi:MAG: hypothetical protein IKQ46_14565 [Bacteroidales bacterium]|jgi:arginyl-tRNA synthetase|nr:hypothetical protein [Bacteroidales bacterium]